MDFNKKYNLTELISEDEINQRIKELGKEITEKFNGEKVYLVCILRGSLIFAAELAKRIELPMEIDFMQVSSYGSQTKTSGVININKDLEKDICNENVIIVEDIIDSGNTLSKLIELFKSRNPKTLTLCTLLDKPERRESFVNVDYVGFTVPDKFIVGYGLDYDQRFRNLPYVAFIEN